MFHWYKEKLFKELVLAKKDVGVTKKDKTEMNKVIFYVWWVY